jgi:hypothetical protein
MYQKHLNMKKISNYLDFIRKNGRLLSEINPGSKEIALTVKDALQALELLIDSQIAILGGDILSEDNNRLIYAYQLWGSEYHFLNWYCDRKDNESEKYFLNRSYNTAKVSIINAKKIADQLKQSCYIVLVI